MTRLADKFPALRDATIGVAITALAACAFAQEPPVSDDDVMTDDTAASSDTDASYTTETTPEGTFITKDPASDVAGNVETYEDGLSDDALTADDPFAEDMDDEDPLDDGTSMDADEEPMWSSDDTEDEDPNL